MKRLRVDELEPSDVDEAAMLAWSQLAVGRRAIGMETLAAALRLDPTPGEAALELAFLGYLFTAGEERQRHLRQVAELLLSGIRTDDWRYDECIEQVEEEHDEIGWLCELADVINGQADIRSLERWPAWRSLALEACLDSVG